MVHLPFDVHQLGRLARRDLERACHLFLESSADDMSGVLSALRAELPTGWDPDLLPLLSWVAEAVAESSAGWSPDELLHRLFDPNCIALSPISLVRKPLAPGDEISEVLARRMGGILQHVGGEGDRLVSLDTVVLLLGSHLGYLSASSEVVRGKRVTRLEQEAIARGYSRIRLVNDLYGAQDPRNELLHLECERLALAPNFDLPATLARLESLTREQRALLWSEILEHQRRTALPAERRPTFSMLLDRIIQRGLPVESPHVGRLLSIAAHLHGQLQRNPDVDTGYVFATLEELEEYLHWEPAVTVLPKYRSVQGVRLLNRALLQLAAGHRSYGWPVSLEPELVEFRESFLKRLHERRLEDLLCIDPAEWIRHGMRRNRERMVPELGEPARLLEAWGELDLELSARLENAPIDWLPGAIPEPVHRLEKRAQAEPVGDEDEDLADGDVVGLAVEVLTGTPEQAYAEAVGAAEEISGEVVGAAQEPVGAAEDAAEDAAKDAGEEPVGAAEVGSELAVGAEESARQDDSDEATGSAEEAVEALEDDSEDGSDAEDFFSLNEDSISLVVKVSEEVRPMPGESTAPPAELEAVSDDSRSPSPFLRRTVVEATGEADAPPPRARAVAAIPPPVSDDEAPPHDWEVPLPPPSVTTIAPGSPAAAGPDDIDLGAEERSEAGRVDDLDGGDEEDEDPSVALKLEVDEQSLEVRASVPGESAPFGMHGSLPFADTGLSGARSLPFADPGGMLPFADTGEEDARALPSADDAEDEAAGAGAPDIRPEIDAERAAATGAEIAAATGAESAAATGSASTAGTGAEIDATTGAGSASATGAEIDPASAAATGSAGTAGTGAATGAEARAELPATADATADAEADATAEAAPRAGRDVATAAGREAAGTTHAAPITAGGAALEPADDDEEEEAQISLDRLAAMLDLARVIGEAEDRGGISGSFPLPMLEDPDDRIGTTGSFPLPTLDAESEEGAVEVAAETALEAGVVAAGYLPVDDWSDVRAATTGSLPVPMPEDDTGEPEPPTRAEAAANARGELEEMVRELGKVVQELENADIDLEPILGFQREASNGWTPGGARPTGPTLPDPTRPVKIPKLHPLLVSPDESEPVADQDEWETPREAEE